MYASSNKNINRHKSFDALSGRNFHKREELKAQKREREEKAEERLAVLSKEQREARLNAQIDAAEGLDEGHTAMLKNTAWMLEGPAVDKEVAGGPNPNSNPSLGTGGANTSSTAASSNSASAKTGTVTKEEAEAARKLLSDEKKRRLNPFARSEAALDQAVRARLLASSTYSSTSAATTPSNTTATAAAPSAALAPSNGGGLCAGGGSGINNNSNASKLQSLMQRARR